MAAAPGHPFLAKAVETVVNQVRNKFTSTDIDASYCPGPAMSTLHVVETLFIAGPCLLGASMNRVLGRTPQQQFEAGEVPPVPGRDESLPMVPGRTIILNQNKKDSHRFTDVIDNRIIASTDIPDSTDVKGKRVHYSKGRTRFHIYGLVQVYHDLHKANEDIRILVVTDRQSTPPAASSVELLPTSKRIKTYETARA
jgi:hypothetical protein